MIRFKSHSIIFLEPLQTLFINSGRYERQHRTKSIISNRGWAPDLGRGIWRDQVSLCVKSSLWVPGHSCSRGASDHRQGGQDGGFCPGPHITAFIFSLSYFYLPRPKSVRIKPRVLLQCCHTWTIWTPESYVIARGLKVSSDRHGFLIQKEGSGHVYLGHHFPESGTLWAHCNRPKTKCPMTAWACIVGCGLNPQTN